MPWLYCLYREISDLGKAAKENSVTFYTYKGTPLPQILNNSDFDSWNSIGKCLQRNEIISEEEDVEEAFVKELAGKVFLGANNYLEPYKRGYFISEQLFFNIMFGSPISRNFCCKRI